MTHPSGRNPLVVSLGLFTTIPMPSVAEIGPRMAARAMASFPLVGVLVGALAGAVTWGATWLGGPLLGPVLGLGVLALVTGALHLDGLADTADGLGSRKPPEVALEIMRRSDIGPMGVMALLFVLLADVAALSRIAAVHPAAGGVALLTAAVLGRVAVVCSTTSSEKGARAKGFGALFHGVTTVPTALLWAVAGVVLSGLLGWVTLALPGSLVLGVSGIASLAIGWLWRGRLSRRLGGMTGDMFGSIIEVTQATFLVCTALGFGAGTLL